MGTPLMPPRAEVVNYQRGTLVRALALLDEGAAHVEKGTFGVVFEEANAYGDGCGPMVRWLTGGACNVYRDDVEVVPRLPGAAAAWRPYAPEEIAELTSRLDAVLLTLPSVVGFTCQMLLAAAWLRHYVETEPRGPLPAPLEAIQGAVDEALPSLFHACERGPYNGVKVV